MVALAAFVEELAVSVFLVFFLDGPDGSHFEAGGLRLRGDICKPNGKIDVCFMAAVLTATNLLQRCSPVKVTLSRSPKGETWYS